MQGPKASLNFIYSIFKANPNLTAPEFSDTIVQYIEENLDSFSKLQIGKLLGIYHHSETFNYSYLDLKVKLNEIHKHK
jgi:hypothetical protein